MRSNDCDYMFRPHSAFAHLTGLGSDRKPDAVLLLEPRQNGSHESILYHRPLAGRDTEEYLDAELVPGMILTVEPGLYFKADDLLVPAGLRGIGVRIEDDILVTKDGCENLSAAIPRTSRDVEAWIAPIRRAESPAGIRVSDQRATSGTAVLAISRLARSGPFSDEN